MIQVLIQLVFLEALTVSALLIIFASFSKQSLQAIGHRFPFLVLVIPAALFLTPSLWLLHILALVAVPLLARRRAEVSSLYLSALLVSPSLVTELAFNFRIDIHTSLGAGALAALLFKYPRSKANFGRIDAALLTILAFLVLPYARGETITAAIRAIIQQGLVYGIPYYVVSRSLRSREDVRTVLTGLAATGILLSVVLLFEARTTWQLYRFLYGHYGLDLTSAMGSVQMRFGLMRAVGPFLEPTSMAFALLLCVFAAFGALRYRSPIWRLATTVILLGGLFVPQSRGAWIGLIVGLLVAGASLRRYGQSAAAICAAALILGLAQVDPRVSEALGISGNATGTVEYRQRLFDRGVEEVYRNPIIGSSEKSVYSSLADLEQGQGIIDFVNTYLYIALVSGFLGLFAFLACLVTAPLSIWRYLSKWKLSSDDRRMASFLVAALIAPIEMFAFTSFGGRPAVLILVYMALGSTLLHARGLPRPLQSTVAGNEFATASPDAQPP